MTIKYTLPSSTNVRSSAEFGNNIIGSAEFNTRCEVTGNQVGDRWLPVRLDLAGQPTEGFVSKNVLRDPVSDPREALVANCVAEWLRFEKGTRKEFEDPWFRRVGDYWANIGMNLDGRDRDVPWSAAFVSFVVRNAGPAYAGFVFAAAHARYIHASIVARESGTDAPFWGFRLSEHKPQLGDLVCRGRTNQNITYDFARQEDAFFSHCDVVCRIEDGKVFAIGGNVSQSARHTFYPTDANGALLPERKVFAVLRNNR